MVNISNYRTISNIIGYELMNELLMNVGRIMINTKKA